MRTTRPVAERGVNPRTLGLRAQHASHCSTPLVAHDIGQPDLHPRCALQIVLGGCHSWLHSDDCS
eukprot:7282147-Heterocapsa_arctica.AAC.1